MLLLRVPRVSTLRLLVAIGAVALVSHHALSKPAAFIRPASSSPWCRNRSAAAQVGMYGPLGESIGLGGPEREGVYVDVPVDVAQLFNQGLAHFWGFNAPEACRNFQTAAAISPECALCHWGVALCNGPHIQLGMYGEQVAALNKAASRAHALAQAQPSLSDKTRRLIAGAMALVGEEADVPPYPARNRYTRVMCAPMPGNVSDPDIDAMCGGALMSCSPWEYYAGVAAGGRYPLKPTMEEAKARLLSSVMRGRRGGRYAATTTWVTDDQPSPRPW
jgi:hypothetical protein